MSFPTPTFVYSGSCFNCDSEFNFWKGRFRYHCRCCGNNFCSDCVPNNCPLPRIRITKDVRTCDSCFQKYSNPRREERGNNIFFDPDTRTFRFEADDNVDHLFRTIHLDDDEYEEIEEIEEIEENEETQVENAQYMPGQTVATPGDDSRCSSNLFRSMDEETQSNIPGRESEANKTNTDELVEDRQLEIALTLSRIENKFLQYTTSSDTALMSEEEQVEYLLRLSALEEKAKTIVSRFQVPQMCSKNGDEDEDLSLALAISKIESEDAQSLQEERKPKENATKRQIQCPICFEERLEYALVACGHVVCGDCKPKLEECPICRADIRGAIRVYITD